MDASNDALERAVSAHYTRPDLADAILAAVREAGGDPDHPTIADLAAFDHFHSGFHAATLALVRLADLPRGARVLDIGGGLGGPARTLAHDLACTVTVVDATRTFCEAGQALTARTGLDDRVSFQVGSALDLPFPDGSFDAVWMQNVGMNIAEKAKLFAEISRVLIPGGRLALQEVLAGGTQPAHYPMPWASEAGQSFLATPDDLRSLLADAGLRVVAWEEGGTFPPTPGTPVAPPLPILIWGEETMRIMGENGRRNVAEGRIINTMVIADRA